MKMMKWTVSVSAVLLIGSSMVVNAAERRHPVTEEPWEWTVTPYFFLPAVNTDATVAGQTADVDMSFKDVVSDFDAMALSLRTEGWKGEYGFILDGTWTDLDGNFGPGEAVNVQVAQWYVDALLAGRTRQDVGGGVPNWWDFTMGPRYSSLKQEISMPATGTVGGTETWVDFMIGMRMIWKLGQSDWVYMLRGDIGGFGWGSSSDITGSFTTGFGWLFADQWSLDLGYRYYYLDYETMRSDGKFAFKGSEQGAWLGLTWKY